MKTKAEKKMKGLTKLWTGINKLVSESAQNPHQEYSSCASTNTYRLCRSTLVCPTGYCVMKLLNKWTLILLG